MGKAKVWGSNVASNKARKAAKHAKRMKRQQAKQPKVPKGTGRMRTRPMREARRKKDHGERVFWLSHFAALYDSAQVSERERRLEARKRDTVVETQQAA